jgi:CDP-diacylglycerol--glycerol-3-phosphate 3-phosphatidyltransferase
MLLRDTALARAYYRVIDAFLLTPLSRVFSHPNQITVLGAILSVLVPAGFLLHPAAGLCAILASAVVDSLDGLLARKKGLGSDFGAFLDSSLDRVSDFFYLIGFWVLFIGLPGFARASLLTMVAILATVLISYTKARAEGQGGTCETGLMGRAPRIIYLLAWALLLAVFPTARQPVLWWGLGIYTALTTFTVVQRILHVKRVGLPG